VLAEAVVDDPRDSCWRTQSARRLRARQR